MSSFKILENTIDITKGFTLLINSAVNQLDGFGVTNESPLLLESDLIQNCIKNLRINGKRVRYITDIKNSNLESCQRIMQLVELRHLDNIQGGMIINDGEYLSLLESGNDTNNVKPVHIYSKNKWLVEQQKLLFDMLWEKSIPAKIRIKQIEHGLEKDVCELITDENNTMRRYEQALRNLSKELHIFYSISDNSESTESILQKLSDVIKRISKDKLKHIRIILIVLTSNTVEKTSLISKFGQIEKDIDLQIKFMNREFTDFPLSRDLMILIVDRNELFISEIKSIEGLPRSIFENDINFTIHSNSRSVVSTYNVILEMLWNQDELYKKSETALTQLKFHDKLQQEFVHNFANGLRNPIQPILGFSEILLDHKEDFKKYQEVINIINMCAVKLATHVNNMIDITELENNSFSLNKEAIDLDRLIEDIINQLEKNNFELRKKNISVYKKNDKVKVFADKVRLKNAIENLITNAIDAPNSNNIKITIDYGNTNYGSSNNEDLNLVFVSIVDDGEGIDRLLLPMLFSKFVTNSRSGLGLGLYLARIVIKKHGGDIWVENNKKEHGATFRFSLPKLLN